MKNKQLILRPYQQEAINEIEAMIAMGSTHIGLSAETSFGKGVVIAKLAENYQHLGIIILVNIESLIDQIADNLKLLNIDYSILKAGRTKDFDSSKKVQLVMSQTLHARLKDKSHDEIFDNKFYLYIQDEIHREFDTSRTSSILDFLQPTVRIGLSATIWDSYGYALKDIEIVETATTHSLTDAGYLAPLHYYVPKWAEKIDYSKVKKKWC